MSNRNYKLYYQNHKEYHRRYYKENKKIMIEKALERYKMNRDKYNDYNKEYRKKQNQQKLSERVDYVDNDDLVLGDYFD